MNINPNIDEFVASLEIFTKKKLNNPLEVNEILQIVVQTGLTREFEELIFHAKFLIRTQEVLKQIGSDDERFEKLSTEFQSGLSRSMELLNMLVGRATKDVAQKYSNAFFAAEPQSLSRLMKFYADLSWIKNWQIDGKPLPYETKSLTTPSVDGYIHQGTPGSMQLGQTSKSHSRIKKSALLAAILFILFLLIDSPVTILGWILSLWITALLVYIVIQIIPLTRIQASHLKNRIDANEK